MTLLQVSFLTYVEPNFSWIRVLPRK